MKKTSKKITETEGQFIMQQEVVDWKKVTGIYKCGSVGQTMGNSNIRFVEDLGDKPNALKGATVQDIKDASNILGKTLTNKQNIECIKESFIKVINPETVNIGVNRTYKTISMPDNSKCIFFTEKDKYKALGVCSSKLIWIKSEDKAYINHSLFYNDISEVWVCMIFYFD